MREVELPEPRSPLEASSFRACVATILERAAEEVPQAGAGEDPARGWTISRWLGGLGLGIVPVADAASFSWAGPWLARVRPPEAEPRFVVL